MENSMQTDVLIIGSGIAGATTALRLSSDRQRQIVMVTRAEKPTESNTQYAQGGIVGRGRKDSVDILTQDVLRAGAGLSYPAAVQVMAEYGPDLITEILIEQAGLDFDRGDDGELGYGLEAAHSQRRVLHVGDATGRAIMSALMEKIAQQPNIQLLTSQTVVDLITFPHHAIDPMEVYNPVTCHGAYVLDQNDNRVYSILADSTVLATGGLGQIYQNTTNPPGARGDGLAMAYRAGARVINTEYIQFHPTAFALPGVTRFLISEAVRGEGAALLTPNGQSFMERYAPKWKELAPRDVVARAIYWEMIDNNYPYVLIDIASHQPADYIRRRFPQIYGHCMQQNIDITQQPIPVVPAAHYFCGGVMSDLRGRTTLDGLYAIGEVSCTGVHGANRLASTSLLEGLVWGARAAQDIRQKESRPRLQEGEVPPWDVANSLYDSDPALIQGDMQTIRNLMWHYVGLVRSEYRLRRAIRNLRQLWADIEEFYRKTRLTDGLIGLRNSAQTALIVARSARRNRVSRGCHYRDDSFAADPLARPPEDRDIELDSAA